MSNEHKPILPSSLLEKIDPKQFSYIQKTYDNTKLRVGVVLEIIESDDKEDNNRHGVGPEYNVLTIEQHKGKGITASDYKNCIALSNFGGAADFLEYKYRTPEDQQKVRDKGSFKEQVGSLVLVLCQDGVSDKGIIVGAIGHPDRKSTLTEENGHHLEGEFNGLNWQINKDGALTITFKSPTKGDGTALDETAEKEAGGTHIQMDKAGQVDINTNLEGEDETFIRMDKKNRDIGLKAGANIDLTAKKNIGFTADGNINANAKGNLLAKAEGTANLESGGAFTLKAGGAMTMDVADLQIMSQAGVMIQTQQVIVDAPLILVGNGGTPALVLSTQFLGIGNLGAPVVSQAIGPFSSSVFIGA